MLVLAASTADTGMTTLGTVFTQFMDWLTELYGVITTHPILMLTVGIFCVGAAIGLAYRLIRG